MKKLLIVLAGLFVLILVLLGVVYLTIRGRMPVLSDMVFKQVELGVKESPDEMYAFYDEIGYVDNLKGTSPKSGELIFSDEIELDHTFTQSEINSWIAAWEGEWADLPFTNSQIRIDSDGTVEASSTISVETAEEFARTLGYTDEEINKAKSYLKFVPAQVPLYAKGTAEIHDNDVMIVVQSFKVAGYTPPHGVDTALGAVLAGITEKTIRLSDKTDLQSVVVTSEGVDVTGTVPGSVDVR